MGKSLSRRSKQRLQRMTESLTKSAELADSISAEAIGDLIRRDAISTKPSSMTGSNLNFSRSGGGEVSSPVERAVISMTSSRQAKDPVRSALREIERHVLSAERSLRSADQALRAIQQGEDKKRGRASSSPCEMDCPLPAVKAGVCMDHYMEWVDAGAPDRMRWKAFKLGTTSSEGLVLVVSPPPPTRPIS